MSLNMNLKIIESDNKIAQSILVALKPQVDKYFKRVFDTVKTQIPPIVISAIQNSPEYDELISGQLKAEFGLPDSISRVNTIVDAWSSNISLVYNPIIVKAGGLQGSFSIGMIQSDFADVLGLSAASFTTEKGDILNWLEWLLLLGNRTIIKDYEVELGSNPRSRTGMAVMRGVTRGKWSVPPEFSGTMNNNWITRAIDSVDNEINNLITKNMR